MTELSNKVAIVTGAAMGYKDGGPSIGGAISIRLASDGYKVVVVDIGCGGTSISVFEDGATLHTAVIPVGGENVTNDIAIGIRTSIDTAEKVKIEYGSTMPEDVNDREVVDLSTISKIDTHSVSKKQIVEIIQARYHEIFVLVKYSDGCATFYRSKIV